MSRWPKDNPAALAAFYGDPGTGEVEKQLVAVTPPFKMYYESKPVKSIRFHKKAAPALLAALNQIWDYYGHDQAKIDALGISKYAGSYNARKIAGSSKWSNHAYGAAIDLNAEENGFGKGKGTIPAAVVAAFKRQGARWGGDYKGRTDPMHFEFCDNGETEFPPMPPKPKKAPAPAPKPKPAPEPEPAEPVPPSAPAPQPEPAPAEPEKPGFFRRIRNWVVGTFSGVGGFGFLAYLTDWQVALVFFGSLIVLLLIVVGLAVWLAGGREPLRNAISKVLSR